MPPPGVGEDDRLSINAETGKKLNGESYVPLR